MKDGEDRKAYDALVLDNMDGINNRLDKTDNRLDELRAEQTKHNLEIAQRMSVVETKAMILGGVIGTVGGQLVDILRDAIK